jgi:hypothetical protein
VGEEWLTHLRVSEEEHKVVEGWWRSRGSLTTGFVEVKHRSRAGEDVEW